MTGVSVRRFKPSFLQYVRPDEEIAAVIGDAVLAEARVNPDGTLDFTRWARPQTDGPALQVLALTRWRDAQPILDETLRAAMLELVVSDLDFIQSHASKRSFDIWEEEFGYHYYTQLVQVEALARGAEWLAEAGDSAGARVMPFPPRTNSLLASTPIGALLTAITARGAASSAARRIRLSTSQSFSACFMPDARRERTSVLDPKAQATLTALEDLFDAEYAINRRRPSDGGPAMGRYANDTYYGGNPWYLATLAAAEFYFKLAIALLSGAKMAVASENERFRRRLIAAEGARESADFAAAAFEYGDSFMRTVKAFTPPSGDLSEQFDRTTGEQTSAKHLAWSYAAFITAAASRRRAAQAIRG